MLRKVLSFIRANDLLHAGERLGVAVSGGADSVARLCALSELRAELGFVLSVVHLHHGIRPDADADANFVGELAGRYGVDLHLRRTDVPVLAREKRLGLEAAGRDARYGYFAELMATGKLDKVATAHTLDDQAETVLLRIIRGSGLRGLAGIHKRRLIGRGEVIRPMLGVSRAEVLTFLQNRRQDWREDTTNSDLRLARNRVRHELLPMLEQNHNPAIRETLAGLAEIALADSDYLVQQTTAILADVLEEEHHAILVKPLLELPVALQRQVLIAASQKMIGHRLELAEIEDLRRLAAGKISARQLNNQFRVERVRTHSGLTLRFLAEERKNDAQVNFEYLLDMPGEVHVPELNSVVRARLVEVNSTGESYNPAELLDPARLRSPLTLRNYRPGDRFHPLRTKAAEKLKRLFLEKKVPQEQRLQWPVVVCGSTVVWVRGFAVSAEHALKRGTGEAVLIEEVKLQKERTGE